MHKLGLLTALCKSANPEIKHTINLNKNIKNSQHQKLKSPCVHMCWSFSSPAQQLANSCTPCLSLISILKTNILKNTPHKTLLEKPGTVSRYQRGSAGAGVPETWLCTSRASSPRLLLPRNGSAGEERAAGNRVRMGSLVLLPALPDIQGVKRAANTVPHSASFSTPAKTRKYQRGDSQGKCSVKWNTKSTEWPRLTKAKIQGSVGTA